MKSSRLHGFWFGATIILLLANAVHAGVFTFKADVDKTRMAFEDVLVLSFIISGDNMVTDLRPELPDLKKDFDVLRGPNQSSSISIINGKYTSSISYQYMLSPKNTGTLEIGSATLNYEGKTYTTDPIKVEVVKGAAPDQTPQGPSQQGQGSPQQTEQPEVFLKAEVDKETAYIGEQITVSFYLYTQVNISGYDISQQPQFTGFWVEELQTPSPPKLQYVALNGQQYGVALMKKTALFPTTSGEVTIDPLVMTLAVRTRSRARAWSNDPFNQLFDDPFFGGTQEVIRKTQPLVLKILPLPEENRPATFNGDVGSYSMSVTTSAQKVTQDEPITLTVKIQGSGNIKTIKEPVITLPEAFKRYDTQITENPFPLQEPLQGEKIFETVIIPSQDGEFQIAPVQFSYFDPQRQTYQTLHSEPIHLVVLPKAQAETPVERLITTKEEVKLLGQDIRFIKTNMPRLTDQRGSWHQSGMFLLLHIVPILAIIAAFGYKHYRDTYMRDERYVRQKRANKQSKTRLKTAGQLMQQGNSKAFYAEISNILRQYLGDKLNLPPAGISGEISQILIEQGLDEDSAQLLKNCLEQCDYARFAPIDASNKDMQTMLEHVEAIISQVERLNGLKPLKTMRVPLSVLLVFACTSIVVSSRVWCATSSVEELFQQGNAFYEQENYQEAIARYRGILTSGIENGYVYYNLGNALLKSQKIGEAILNYERARRLLPRDEDVAFNLQYARALTLDKMEQESDGKILEMLKQMREAFTPDEVGFVMLFFFLLLSLLMIMGIFASRQWRKRLLYIGALPALFWIVSGILFMSIASHYSSTTEAILLAPQVEAKTGPGEGYSAVFAIHEGARVRIQRERLDWVEIQLPNKVIGWVMRKDLERIHPQ
ncbi:hypothetical protein U27_00028 [Candidatus Vecturithrix granuli]|uniref:Uncharacterized protein n=1 Tax=Vecturithrix granuli TaxID=1499967 RepID=A0A081C6D2_VECG1|nr:hypothetical protein U27_00028 [Candidatus Vecturithrix granuli]